MNQRGIVLTGLVLLVLIWWWQKNQRWGGTSQPGQPGNNYGSNGCGCNGTQAYSTASATAPPSQQSTSAPWTLQSTLVPIGPAVADLAGAPAPGSNVYSAGSGGNWQGLNTWQDTVLTPGSIPSTPVLPVSNYVRNADWTPTIVRAN